MDIVLLTNPAISPEKMTEEGTVSCILGFCPLETVSRTWMQKQWLHYFFGFSFFFCWNVFLVFSFLACGGCMGTLCDKALAQTKIQILIQTSLN